MSCRLRRFGSTLPLRPNMEREQNSLLQQRAHLRCWHDRGYGGEANIGAGHIRWGKDKGLTSKLGKLPRAMAAERIAAAEQRASSPEEIRIVECKT